MFDKLISFFKKLNKKEQQKNPSKDTAKERLHLVLMQDRANVSADFLELMKQEIIEVIKKYIDIDEKSIDVRLTNESNEDGTNGAPALYANIPILNVRNDMKKEVIKENEKKDNKDDKTEKKDTEEILKTVEEIKENIEEEQKQEENTNENIEESVDQEENIIEEIQESSQKYIEENNKNIFSYNEKKKNRKKKHKYK